MSTTTFGVEGLLVTGQVHRVQRADQHVDRGVHVHVRADHPLANARLQDAPRA